LLHLNGFEVVHQSGHILLPTRLPLVTRLTNRYLAHVPGLRWLCLTNWVVARPLELEPLAAAPTVSVICPCRNEAGNIEQIVRGLPNVRAHGGLISVGGTSRDTAVEERGGLPAEPPAMDIKVFAQEGHGKGDAVRLGFTKATGDILMILDADLSVAPEDLPQFCEALVSGKGEFVNGSRLVFV